MITDHDGSSGVECEGCGSAVNWRDIQLTSDDVRLCPNCFDEARAAALGESQASVEQKGREENGTV